MPWAGDLRTHWEGKVDRFVNRTPNLYGSEFAFDSTGFESTGSFARYANTHQMSTVTPEAVRKFTGFQLSLDMADRGWLETTYYQMGSDYRGNLSYLLSYMSKFCSGGSTSLTVNVRNVNLADGVALQVTIDFKPIGTIALSGGSGRLVTSLGHFAVSFDQVRVKNGDATILQGGSFR